ncbi:hypothetical protein [Candidatus Enterococcus ferrettii]|uniref:Rad50/SbcC-type AAA domain-containing protein n=1 Tax=Candidatus Enterococcus ferrettii TaxID=2815324 RepID=A0ABV0ESS8_9ENTE|nr:hypothetical protein [Enterococcus sp. 665A]MBO1338916.1 hypothetical protein [Enterococcus sp. 665A]
MRIQRLKVEIVTLKKSFVFDENFYPGTNFVESSTNTKGKSSAIAGIYYALGFEQIIGEKKGVQVLSSAYKNIIKDEDDNNLNVLESKVFLELEKDSDIITILRTGKSLSRKESLVSVYFSSLENIYKEDTKREDFFVHLPNSAKNQKGFHRFLEKFCGLNLPEVPTSDDSERKLYLQILFSSMFIEQKRGWSDIFSSMPYLGIRDSKKE